MGFEDFAQNIPSTWQTNKQEPTFKKRDFLRFLAKKLKKNVCVWKKSINFAADFGK